MQQLRSRAVLWVALAVFTASGFSGLIYESIWSHYLKLFLGHAAYAQTLVLAIFMGGMAGGAWLASRFTARLRNLLLGYAVAEALIGIASLGFHETFVTATAFAFDRAIPAIGSPLAVDGFKWGLASLLILPQSVLLGMTFPLMAGGVLRLQPERSGYALAMLYFTNSLGAAAGVLASGFYFIPAVGLPGTLAAAAVVNLAVAAAVALLPSMAGRPAVAPSLPAGAPRAAGSRLLLCVAAITGLSSFMYEVGWIRMLSLVLGSSTHAFELMLAAFILGIAFGGLWVRRRIDAAASTERFLGMVQLAMGVAAVATLPVYAWTFEAMEVTLRTVARTDSGYLAFNAVSQALALAVMFPAAFFAGMTLPLITASLLRRGAGERAIGQVYAANTAGAIAGVALAVHVGFPYLGLKGLIVVAAGIDVALGLLLLRPSAAVSRGGLPWAAGAAAVALVSLAGVALKFDAAHLASGVFRTGVLKGTGKVEVEAHIDGKTATVSVVRSGGDVVALRTNGKTDGAVRMGGGEPLGDEVTMTLSGALPLILAPEARHVANIGFGTGLTTHVLLASETLEAVDTVEIEPAMVRAAAHLRPRNARALDDPRSHLHFEDAKTYFASRQVRYDVIISEPSNPWVSGVAGLFSTEFYRHVRRYLKDDGLLVQWVQAYEMTPRLLATILLALDENFSDYELWQPNDGDILIVAVQRGRVPDPDEGALGNVRLRAELVRLGIDSMDDLLMHRVAGKDALGPYFASFGVQPNSDFFPVLDIEAPRARFLRAFAGELALLMEAGVPLLELFDARTRVPDPAALTPGAQPWLRRHVNARQAGALASFLLSGERGSLASLDTKLAGEAMLVRAALVECSLRAPPPLLREALSSIARPVNQQLPRRDRERLWSVVDGSRCPMDAEVRAWLRVHAATGAASPAEMAAAAAAILAGPDALSPRQTADLLAVRMIGLILTGQHGLAQREFVARRGRMGNDEATRARFRLIVGHIVQPVRGPDRLTKFGSR